MKNKILVFYKNRAGKTAHQLNQEHEWRAREYNRLYNKAVSLCIDKLGDKDDETNLELVKYLESLEQRIQSLEHKAEV